MSWEERPRTLNEVIIHQTEQTVQKLREEKAELEKELEDMRAAYLKLMQEATEELDQANTQFKTAVETSRLTQEAMLGVIRDLVEENKSIKQLLNVQNEGHIVWKMD